MNTGWLHLAQGSLRTEPALRTDTWKIYKKNYYRIYKCYINKFHSCTEFTEVLKVNFSYKFTLYRRKTYSECRQI